MHDKINKLFSIKYILDDVVSCQSVSIFTSGKVNYQEDKLKLACQPSQVSMWKGVTNFTLSKHTSTGYQDIVMVYLNTSNSHILYWRNETVWTQQGWQQRANIITEYIQPLNSNSGIGFDIRPEDVLCSDEGIYRCKAFGRLLSNDPIERETIGSVELKGILLNEANKEYKRKYPN